MIPDPTTEIKRIRHQLGTDADYSLDRIFDHLQRRQATSGRHYVRLPSRKPADNQSLDQSRRSGGNQVVR